MLPLLNPTLDVVFKLLFAHERNRGLLASLLTAVLEPDEPITDIDVQNPEVPKVATFGLQRRPTCDPPRGALVIQMPALGDVVAALS